MRAGDSRAEVRRLSQVGFHDEAIAMLDRIMGDGAESDDEAQVVLSPLERLDVQLTGPEHPDWGW